MKIYRDRNARPKAFIGAAISAGMGLAKGIAGGIKQRKANQQQQQQNYLSAVLQSKGAMDSELIANEGLAEQFEDKFVARCGGKKKLSCGGRKKASLGTGLLAAPSLAQGNPLDINAENANLQKAASAAMPAASAGGGIMGMLSGGAGASIGGAVGNVVGGMANKLIAGPAPKKVEAFKPTIRTKPLSNINTTSNPAQNSVAENVNVPTGMLQSNFTDRNAARFGGRKRKIGYTRLAK